MPQVSQKISKPEEAVPSAFFQQPRRGSPTGRGWKLGEFLAELKRRNLVLWRVGLVQIVLFLLSVPGLVWDSRVVTGVNPWIKPMKFDLSIAIYCWTMGWILNELPGLFARKISARIAACMLIEIVVITFQAARGVPSHFNGSTPFNFAMYGIMGSAIFYNTFLLVRVLMRFLSEGLPLPLLATRGIQLGLISILLGSASGMVMVFHGAHSVGVADGGPGLPFVNWSTRGGDLRIAHFLGLHGLQFMVFLGYGLAAPALKWAEATRLKILHAAFAGHVLILVLALVCALMGHPVISK